MKNILITGISTGIGRDATEYLLKKGYRVFGSVRNLSDADDLINNNPENFINLVFCF